MRILVVTISAPLPANNGQRLRNWAMLRALAEEGHQVSLLVMERTGEVADYPGLKAVCQDVETIHFRWSELSTGSDYWGRLRSSFHKLPHSVRRFASPEIASRIAALLGSGRFDAAICEGCHAMVNFPEHSPIPVILDNHNVEHLLLERYAERETNPAKRWYARAEASKMRRWDRSICARSAAILACSRFDQQHLLSLSPGSHIAVAPNVIDMDGYAAAAGDGGKTVVYVGGMDWFPNRDAVQHFAFDILPLLKERAGNVRFLVAGRTGPADFVSQFDNVEGIEFTGTVDDIRPFIADSAVCVVPLRIGSGTRLKILEEAAMGKAIVSTPLGAEGLELSHGSEILLASSAREFADATARLLNDAAARQEMGQAARRKVEREYGLPALRASLRPVFAGMENRADKRKEVADDVAVV
jgi:glycosyltransferase involved in cell wall biosynthesis